MRIYKLVMCDSLGSRIEGVFNSLSILADDYRILKDNNPYNWNINISNFDVGESVIKIYFSSPDNCFIVEKVYNDPLLQNEYGKKIPIYIENEAGLESNALDESIAGNIHSAVEKSRDE